MALHFFDRILLEGWIKGDSEVQALMTAVTKRSILAASAHAEVVFSLLCSEFGRSVRRSFVRTIAEGLVL